MNKKSIERLTEFLDSECDDYGLSYTYNWCDDTSCFEVEISRYGNTAYESIKYDSEKEDLSIEMGEDCWEDIREFDWTVKYFWMKIAPELFK